MDGKAAYIGIGSNLGDKRSNCSRAIEMIEQIPGCELLRCSDWYLTKPIGTGEQDWYLNGVLAVQTRLPVRGLLGRLMAIERNMGRVRKERWGPRIIDLDILLYGQEIINEENLRVPHPLMHLRRFVLVPLVQLDPNLIHPTLGMSVAELLKRIPENGQEVIRVEDT